MSTVTEVVTKFHDRFYPEVETAVAQSLFADAWKWAVMKFRLRETVVTITLVEGQREYDLTDTVGAIREAYYQPSSEASNWQVLQGVSIDMLARVYEGWRANDSEAMPCRYYLRFDHNADSGKRVIGFDLLPPTTSNAGYPNVTLYTVQGSDLTGSEAIPPFLLTDDWFLYEMAFRWALSKDPERAAYWMKMRDQETGDVSLYLRSGSDDVPPQVRLSPFVNNTSRTI